VIRVAIVDDHAVARYGLASMLAPADDIEVVASLPHPDDLPPVDVVVLDLYLVDGTPALGTIAALRDRAAVLVMSGSRHPADVVAAIRFGACGYLTKDAGPEAFTAAVRAVNGGALYLSPHLADLLHAELARPAPDPARAPALSARERETLGYIARGLTHAQVARRMGVTVATVDTYVARIRGKLHVGNKAELTIAALRYQPPPAD
jgi:DNA-binding NarL/FixJ family response regulator